MAGGVVLAGGRSRRMGTDKALLTLRGVPAVTRVVDALRSAGPVVVVAARHQVLPTVDATIIRDVHDDEGPLPALIRGLRAVGAPAAMVCATDVPLIHPAVVHALLGRLDTHDVVLPVLGGRDQYLTAVYRTTLSTPHGATRVRDLLDGANVLRIDARDLLDDDGVRRHDPHLLSLRTANTPAEWATLDSPGEQSIP